MSEASSLGTIQRAHRAPPRRHERSGRPDAAVTAARVSGPTVLVVDDNPATRRFVRETLAVEGYRVIEADGGTAALGACAREAPDLVLIDLCMSDMRGTDVLRRLRDEPATASTPIVAFTGAPEEIDEAAPGTSGAFSDLIAKPADAGVLLETVRGHLRAPSPGVVDADPVRVRKVLLVDGEPARSIRLRLHLRRLGFDTVGATNAETALEVARRERPDVVVADLLLGGASSLQLTRDIRADADLASIPVVVTSSAPWSPVQERLALRAGATSFVTATPDLGAIRDALVGALDGHPDATSRGNEPPGHDERAEQLLARIHRRHAERIDVTRNLDRDRAERSVLQGLTEIIGGEGDLDDVLAEALARCLHAIGASRGAVFLAGLDGSLALRAHLGDLARLPGARLAAGEELFHRVIASHETIVVDDRGSADAGAPTIVAPIPCGDDGAGVLVVEVPAHEDLRFWMHFLQLVGVGLGFAVANARRSSRLPASPSDTDRSVPDPLTGLATSTHLELDLATALEEATNERPGALLLVDIDRIRHVNDALGHHTGDQLLKGVARRLASVVHPGTTLARLHGDVFAVLVPAVDGTEAVSDLARRLLRSLESPVPCNGYTLYTTASIGVALYPEHARRPGEVLQLAHSALDRAKGRGGDSYDVYTERTGDAIWQRLTVEQGLRAALERDQFVLHYQPIVDLRTGAVASAEALLRWDRPLHGLTTAGGFIDIAEETGLIVPIGAWVMEQAAAQSADWARRGLTIDRLAVNVGAREFHDGRIEETVRRVVGETGIDAARLSLEITERVALADVDHAIATLQRLRDFGVHTALDDFGTGYSSLRYLQALPVDTVKIDRSFVANATADHRGRPILESIIELSHRLGMRVIAEGIETDACLDLVRSLGCDEAQGFHLGHPGPARGLEALL